MPIERSCKVDMNVTQMRRQGFKISSRRSCVEVDLNPLKEDARAHPVWNVPVNMGPDKASARNLSGCSDTSVPELMYCLKPCLSE